MKIFFSSETTQALWRRWGASPQRMLFLAGLIVLVVASVSGFLLSPKIDSSPQSVVLELGRELNALPKNFLPDSSVGEVPPKTLQRISNKLTGDESGFASFDYGQDADGVRELVRMVVKNLQEKGYSEDYWDYAWEAKVYDAKLVPWSYQSGLGYVEKYYVDVLVRGDSHGDAELTYLFTAFVVRGAADEPYKILNFLDFEKEMSTIISEFRSYHASR